MRKRFTKKKKKKFPPFLNLMTSHVTYIMSLDFSFRRLFLTTPIILSNPVEIANNFKKKKNKYFFLILKLNLERGEVSRRGWDPVSRENQMGGN